MTPRQPRTVRKAPRRASAGLSSEVQDAGQLHLGLSFYGSAYCLLQSLVRYQLRVHHRVVVWAKSYQVFDRVLSALRFRGDVVDVDNFHEPTYPTFEAVAAFCFFALVSSMRRLSALLADHFAGASQSAARVGACCAFRNKRRHCQEWRLTYPASGFDAMIKRACGSGILSTVFIATVRRAKLTLLVFTVRLNPNAERLFAVSADKFRSRLLSTSIIVPRCKPGFNDLFATAFAGCHGS